MELFELFHNWVPLYVRYIVLSFLLLIILSANGVYQGMTVDMFNANGEYAEFYTMASNSMFIGMGLSIMFVIRSASRFSNKQLIVTGLLSVLLLTMICMLTSNPVIIIACSFAIGFTKVLALGHVYLKWLSVWSSKMDSSRLYPFLFFVALTGTYLFSWATSQFTYSYSWPYAYLFVIILLLISLLFVFFLVENHSLKKRIPLYQLDIPAMLLLGISLMLINYITVFGNVEDWFASNKITGSILLAIIATLIFIKRELNQKRPFLDLAYFRKANFTFGLILFALLGIFTPPTFQSALTNNVLHLESIRNAEVNLYVIPGILAGAIICYFWYKEKYDGKIIIIAGFTGMVVYHAILYLSFTSHLPLEDFWLPSLIKGMALAFLYISIGLYTTAGFAFKDVLKVVGSVVIVRSFLGGSIFSGLYAHHLYGYRLSHLNYLASSTDSNELSLLKSVDLAQYIKEMHVRALLEASKELSGLIVIEGITLIALLLFWWGHQKINNHFLLTGK